jgi:type VI secretion system protein ImpJ
MWDPYLVNSLLQMSVSHPWGVIVAEFDEKALTLSRLIVTRLKLRLPNGTFVDTELTNDSVPVLNFYSYRKHAVLEFVLALPKEVRLNNIQNDGADVEITHGNLHQQPSLLSSHEALSSQQNLTLRFTHQNNEAYFTCPILRLVRNNLGQLWRDTTFIPPMLTLSASTSLILKLHDLLHCLQTRRIRLMAIRREKSSELTNFAVSDVSMFWLLNTLNSTEPVLVELLEKANKHPEILYRELVRFAGSLLTFSLDYDVSYIPHYCHESPEEVFMPLLSLLKNLLEESLPSGVIAIDLKRTGMLYQGDLSDIRLKEGVDFWISVRSSMPAYELQTHFPEQCIVGFMYAPDVACEKMSGINIKPVIHVPTVVPQRIENQYFSLELSAQVEQKMLRFGRCTFYLPETLKDIEIELFAVLRR